MAMGKCRSWDGGAQLKDSVSSRLCSGVMCGGDGFGEDLGVCAAQIIRVERGDVVEILLLDAHQGGAATRLRREGSARRRGASAGMDWAMAGSQVTITFDGSARSWSRVSKASRRQIPSA